MRVSTELICTKSGCQKALAVHASLWLAHSPLMVEGEMISAQLELNANKYSNAQLCYKLYLKLDGLLERRGDQRPSEGYYAPSPLH